MALKAVKCPSCGGDLYLDDDREFGFCQFCGTKVMLHETVHVKHQLDLSGVARNHLLLARNEFADGKYREAYEHYTKVLEADHEQCEALTRRGICASYLTRISNINMGELTRGYAQSIDIINNRIQNSKSDAEKEAHKNELQMLQNDLTNFITYVNNSFQHIDENHVFENKQAVDRYLDAAINFIGVLQVVNQITPKEFENNLKTQYYILYNICNKILYQPIKYLPSNVNKMAAQNNKNLHLTLKLTEEFKSQVSKVREETIEAYNNLPTFKAALNEFGDTLNKHTSEKTRLEKELIVAKGKSKEAIANFWKDNPDLLKVLKTKKLRTWISVLVGFIALCVLGIIGELNNQVLLTMIGIIVFGVSIFVKVTVAKKVQNKYSASVFPPEIRDMDMQISTLNQQLAAVNKQIIDLNTAINTYRQNNLIG